MPFAPGLRGSRKASVAFAAAASNSSSTLNTLTASSQALGVDLPSRRIILAVRGRNANLSTTANTTAVTVGGVSATKRVDPGSGAVSHWTLWTTARSDSGGPTGTTGTITVNRSNGNGFTFVGFVAFAAYDLRSEVPYVTPITGAGTPASGSIDLAAGGILIAMAHQTSNGAFTWTGATEAVDQTAGVSAAERITGALTSPTAGELAHALQASCGGACELLAASFR